MRLTNSDRDAFVRAVMDDVPAIDYCTQALKKVTEWEYARMPSVIKKAVKEHPEWFERSYLYTPNGLDSIAAYCEGQGYFIRENCPELWADLTAIAEQSKAQEEARRELQRKVRSVIGGCTTLKQAKERLPEFEKYLPADRDGTGVANLPAVSNVVADLTKAGWPKGVKKGGKK